MILSVISLSVVAQGAFANNNNSTATSSLTMQQPKKDESIFSGFLNTSRSTSMVDHQDGSRQDGLDYLMRVNAKLNQDYALRLQGGYSQDLNYSEKNDFADTTLSLLRTPIKIGSIGHYALIGYRAGLSAPTSKASSKGQSLQTAVSAGLTVMANPDRFIKGIEILGGISFGRNIHQYETALDGKVNTQYTSNQTLSVAYGFKYGLSLSGEFIHRNGWSYDGNMKDSFEMSQELGYEMNKTISIALGHTNSGSSLRPNGNESNFQFVDENSSLVYASATLSF
jgi:hypothetical protein